MNALEIKINTIPESYTQYTASQFFLWDIKELTFLIHLSNMYMSISIVDNL